MGGIIKAEKTEFLIKDPGFYLDGRLTAIVDGSQYDFMGRKIFTTGFFRKNIGFGITNIDVEVNASLQPIVTITFKDLYGNAVFGKQMVSEEVPNYSVLFNWPPPKFLFTFKGYLGRQVSWVLNLKQTSTSYKDDGSYEIKCEFIPSQWGFMGDLPFLFLLAVKGLKRDELPPSEFKKQQTIFDLIKIGIKADAKTKEVTKQFDVLLQQMNLIKTNRIVEAICYSKIINFDEKIDGTAGGSKVKSTKDGANSINFHTITFPTPRNSSINSIEKIKEYTGGNADALRKVNTFLLLNATIGSRGSQGISLDSVDFSSGAFKQEEVRKRLKQVDDNIKVIEDAIKKRVYDSTKSKLEKITIGQIFQQIGRDSGYIMGKILEYGARGYDKYKNDRNSLVKKQQIIGKQYPLKVDPVTGTEIPAIGEGVGVEEFELSFVDRFITAVSQGVAKDLVKDDKRGVLQDNDKLVRRIINIEAPKGNPYKPFFRNIAQNIMVRAGIIAFLVRSNDPNYPGWYDNFYFDRASIDEVLELAASDMENITTDMLAEMDESEYILLKKFCYYWVRLISDDGTKVLGSDGKPDGDLEGVEFNQGIPSSAKRNVQVDLSDKSVTWDIFDVYDYVFGKKTTPDLDEVGYDKSNSAFISRSKMQAQAVFNNDILYRVPKTDTVTDDFTFVLFRGGDATKAKEANNAVSDNEARNEDPDATGLLGSVSGQKPLFGIVPIDTYYPTGSEAQNDPTNSGGTITQILAGNSTEPLGRIKFINERFAFAVINYLEIENPLTELFESSGDKWEDRVIYPKDAKIVPSDSVINSYNKQIPANNLAVAVAMAPLSDDQGLVFAPFLKSTSGVNHRASIKRMCNIVLNKMSVVEQEKNQIISDVLGQAIENRDLIYKQFHTLYHQWESLLFDDSKYDALDSTDNFTPIPINSIASTLENRYGSADPKDNKRHYSVRGVDKKTQISGLDTNVFVYDYPLSEKNNVDIKNSIINLDPLYQVDGNTTVLNMFQQLCKKNNFMFVPIPGNGNFNDYEEVFKPSITTKVKLQNLFYVMFNPTPESRVKSINQSKSTLVEDYGISSLSQTAYEVKLGSPDNKVFTNLSVDSYETKTTAESIISNQRATDNDNPHKKIATDCSQLPVMEGRSYTANFDMIGNAQIFPMQYFYLNSIPLFNGIYQVINVKHNITPNDMKTSAEGIRMRFSAGELAAIKPVTLDSLAGLSVVEATVESDDLRGRAVNTTRVAPTYAIGIDGGVEIFDAAQQDLTGGQRDDGITPVRAGDCTNPAPLANQGLATGSNFPIKSDITIAGVRFNNKDGKQQKYVIAEIMPIIKKDYENQTRGFKLLAIAQAIHEGFYPGAKAYTTKNPGNIGNTDSGASSNQLRLENGIKSLFNYIYQAAYKRDRAVARQENHLNQTHFIGTDIYRGSYDSESGTGLGKCVSGFKFNYTGTLGQYLLLYATGPRLSNNYLNSIIGFFALNNVKINNNTTLAEILAIQ